MSKRALYREYRPRDFSEVIGQDHVTTILKNQVREQNFSHAYLFCGSRGTGKTSSAKILARAVNCLSPHDGEPCGECEACRIAKEGTADIIEIDAASNNGVDNVRELIDQAQFAPLQLRYRVFIIDEVHMLSTAAFNALLKTLEEPPAHVLFILATTEPQKLPATIISRCQRFDFHRLTIAHIIARLQTVLKSVGATMEPDGLRLIARAADGGMRDALSLADQCLSFCGSNVTKQDVLDTLGSVGQETLFALSGAIFAGDAAKCMEIVNEIVRNGRDLSVFTNDLNAHLRSLLLAKTCGDCTDLLDVTDDQMAQLLKQAKGASETQILYAMEKLLSAQSNLRYFPAPRILLESTLVRACRPVDEHSVEALEARIAQLEQNGVKVSNVSINTEPPSQSAAEPIHFSSASSNSSSVSEDDYIPEPPPEDVPPWEEEAPTQNVSRETFSSIVKEKLPQTEKKAESDHVKAENTPEPIKSAPIKTTGEADTIWQQVLNKIKVKNPMVYYLAREGSGVAWQDNTLIVEFPTNAETKMNMCNASINMNVIASCLHEIYPEATVLFRAERLNESEQKLKELFGNILKIEE
ncbi:MAG: DNA polymerase III subunit gamma/tau [Clostridia bacterium]|nr:DNA polymerase III subunit gamma/tau [Clostridia bacterium]